MSDGVSGACAAEPVARALELLRHVAARHAVDGRSLLATLLEQIEQVVLLERVRLRTAADAHDARLELEDALEELVEHFGFALEPFN